MSKNIFIFAISLIFPALVVGARPLQGVDVGNGGDAILCRPGGENNFAGYYSLDYLLKYDPTHLPVPISSLEASLNRIESGLKEKWPNEMYLSFREYRSNLFNQTDFTRPRIWEKAAFGLIDLKDEEIVNTLPENCRNGDKISVVQAVIRQEGPRAGLSTGKISYKFVPQVVDELSRQNPLQLSYLIVHEWLWDYGQDVERNRKVNSWLHSDYLENWTSTEWEQNTKGIGFKWPVAPAAAWRPDFCPADSKSAAYVASKRKGPAILMGHGQVYAKTTQCTPGRECAPAMDVSESVQALLNPQADLSVFLSPGGLIVQSYSPSELGVLAIFSCEISWDGGISVTNCPWFGKVDRDGVPLQLTPTIGKDCITFRASNLVTQNGVETKQEYLFAFSGVTFPKK